MVGDLNQKRVGARETNTLVKQPRPIWEAPGELAQGWQVCPGKGRLGAGTVEPPEPNLTLVD